ncbi:class I adenylate-forming enzyme family protein [Paracoccus methylarcula]|nr:class I adenylate-forming enzyme family protein [Paracoccus methylarcula]
MTGSEQAGVVSNLPQCPMTFEQAVQHVESNNPMFRTTSVTLRGITYKAFRNCPRNLPEMMRSSREKHGNGAADYLVYRDERWCYDAFCNDVNKMAHVLRDRFGLSKGSRVAIAMRNYPEFLVMMLAISSIGGVAVLLNAWWTTEEFEYALQDSGAKFVVADGPRLERLQPLTAPLSLTTIGVRDGEALASHAYTALRDGISPGTMLETGIEPDDDFAIIYSSGTTGKPKGVVQTHRGAITAVYSWLMQVAIGPLVTPPGPDTPLMPPASVLIVTPLFHVTASHTQFLYSLAAPAKVTLLHKWDPHEAMRLIKEENVTRFLGVPTQSAELMAAIRDTGETLPSLRYIGAGGAKRPAAQVAKLAETFPMANVATGWGMTETNALGIGMMGNAYKERPNAAGRLYPPVQEIRILDDDGHEVPTGTLGEITVKSLANMRCYLNKPEETAAILKDGWLSTGDLGMIDEEGFVTILDRKKHIIIRGGENISCLEVEGALHRHPDVIEACAFSVPDERLGEIVGIAVHLRDGASLTHAEMADFLKDHLARFKIPEKSWCQHEPLLRGTTDKTDRRAIRAACLGQTS